MKENYKWSLTVLLLAFFISIVMSFLSTSLLESVSLTIAIIVTFIFIIVGIIFDIIGVAFTAGDVVIFHSMSSRKIKGSKIAVKLIKNSHKVSSICCDVIGDICGIISGVAGVSIISLIIKLTSYNEIAVTLLVTALISSLTIGGKALAKNFAIIKSRFVISSVSRFLSFFIKEK